MAVDREEIRRRSVGIIVVEGTARISFAIYDGQEIMKRVPDPMGIIAAVSLIVYYGTATSPFRYLKRNSIQFGRYSA